MSMYGDYIKERLGDGIVERDEGFASYRFLNADGIKKVYIVDIYVRPDFRRTDIASEMADKIADIAKANDCKKMLGTVVPNTTGSTESLKVLLGYGMRLTESRENLIIFEKEI